MAASATVQTQLSSCHDDVSRALRAAWPNNHDLDRILSVPIALSVLYHGLVCLPYATFLSRQIEAPREMLRLPPQVSHPVLITRKLLLLATVIQGIRSKDSIRLRGLDIDSQTIMARVVDVATRLVTNNDELVVGPLEGIECVILESMYHNNAGNLRRAWLTNRRAMVLAQMAGVHNMNSHPMTVLERETRERVDPGYMWARLSFSDRYLSLMLGLPQGSTDDLFATPEALGRCSPMERLERMAAVAGGLILKRNAAERTDLAKTMEVDTMLREAAELMPPQWWLPTPRAAVLAGDDAEAFEESLRLMYHITHRHLLVQLHLPYMLLPSSGEKYDYSKATATDASRAIIAQYVSFRDSMSTAYCRGVDFIAFIASTTLCIAHIVVGRQRRSDDFGGGKSCLQAFRHHRLSDRSLLERALEIMETMARTEDDAVALKISNILRPLLHIEGQSDGTGVSFRVCADPESRCEALQPFDHKENVGSLRIQIPYLGTIRIEKCATERAETSVDARITVPEPAHTSLVGLCDVDSTQTEPIPLASLDGVARVPDWQAAPQSTHSLGILERPSSGDWASTSGAGDAHENGHMLIPGLTTDMNEWALQGVETALFSNLINPFTESN